MIWKSPYKDKFAVGDILTCPAHRPGYCINCKEQWHCHNGWACSYTFPSSEHDKLLPTARFLVDGMLETSEKTQTVTVTIYRTDDEVKKSNEPEWRKWMNVRPGECACGISRTDCTYHRVET